MDEPGEPEPEAVVAPVIKFTGFGFRHVTAAEPAIQELSVEIRAGEYVGVLGATGAGVSTFLASLDGVVPQLIRGDASGAIEVLGRDPRVVPVHELARHVGFVLDDPELATTQATVADEVAFGLENLSVPRAEMDARIDAALRAVGLTGLDAREPTTLSGGELQRLAIACALVSGPSLLVLDEPAANLDPAGRRAVAGVVRRLNREHGVTVVVADQDLEMIAADATRVLVLDRGRLVADGEPRNVLGDPVRLRQWGVRSTQSATLADALGIPAPVPVSAVELARTVTLGPGPASDRRPAEPSSMAPPLIDVQDATFRYPGTSVAAVAGATLAVNAGEVVGLVGANGSGKSTLCRLLQGLIRPQGGRVCVDGLDTASHPARTLAAHVGSVFQDPGKQLFATTVADELALGPRALGLSEARIGERVRAQADALEIGELLTRHPLRLGRAERKLVALGAVLAMGPRVLVLDEPTTGADLRVEGIIEGRVRAAAEEGSAVIVASHDMAFLGRVASRLIVMDGGRVLADAPIHRVFADAPLLAMAGLEPPAVSRVALALADHGPAPWPPVSLDEAIAAFRVPSATPLRESEP